MLIKLLLWMSIMRRLRHPQELEAYYVLPALRRTMAEVMKNELGVQQYKIAEILGVTEAAISQYINKSRAQQIIFGEKMLGEIRESARRLTMDNIDEDLFMFEMQKLLNFCRETGSLCKIHREKAEPPSDCDICFVTE